VIRFNTAPIKKFEKQVGSKRGFRFIATDSKYDYSEINNEYIKIYAYKLKVALDACWKLSVYNEVAFLSDDFIQKCDNLIGKPYWKWWLKKKLGFDRMIIHKKMSTTGLKAIVWALECEYEVSLFGFTPDEKFHYWEDRVGHSNSHDFLKEFQIIKGFENEGKLKIFS